eukprot:TRINITY_DN8170_c0_g1_i1.p1 TRINITY_DN8170_c0_g1~~TRINITY_DN8170_c0_g1_i1.p1  ORF type:complete len:217 (-),score=77.46 TRINITY_DN8170_c0_g1_i1:193-843(-)
MASRGRGRGRGGRGGGRGGFGGGSAGSDDDDDERRSSRAFGIIKTPAPTWPAYDNLPLPPEEVSAEDSTIYTKASLLRESFKASPLYLHKERKASGRYVSSDDPEARLQLLVNYLGPLVQTYPSELSEDRDKIKRKREALANIAKKARPDFEQVVSKLEQQQQNKSKQEAPPQEQDLDADLLANEEDDEDNDYTTNWDDEDRDEGDDDGEGDEAYF